MAQPAAGCGGSPREALRKALLSRSTFLPGDREGSSPVRPPAQPPLTNSDKFSCCAVLCCAVLCCATLCHAMLCYLAPRAPGPGTATHIHALTASGTACTAASPAWSATSRSSSARTAPTAGKRPYSGNEYRQAYFGFEILAMC